jgi:CheY-like chemotaxis protein
VNAWQAMPGGGHLYIQTENIHLDESFVEPFDVQAGRYVKITITDSGVGMDAATQQRIFEPFFTTKEMGRGTGLGLASAYGIIKNHGGLIDVHSTKGKGTTFSIYLPVGEKDVAEIKNLDKEILRGRETILIVDDEDLIIEIGQKMLTKMGYDTLTAQGGQETIEVYRRHGDRIDLTILDMIMPDMNGQETYESLKKLNSAVKVLLSSGYSLNDQARKIMDLGCHGFIQKPFDVIQLSQKIREILDRSDD